MRGLDPRIHVFLNKDVDGREKPGHDRLSLPPVIDDVGAVAAIAGIVVPVHAHALDFRAETGR